MKIASIIGARPQFIKAALVSQALLQRGVEEVSIHTGQHFDDLMSDVFFREMGIPAPRHHFNIGGLSHGAMTGRMLEAIESVLLDEEPSCVLVYGDTNSTLAGALAAVKLKIPVAHVEAGLRSFNRNMPEEINRILTDHTSSTLFAPTPNAVENLLREGVVRESIVLTGDVMYDVALAFDPIAQEHSRILDTLDLKPKSYMLATIHRAENTGDPMRLRAIFEGLGAASRRHPIVLPLHPRTRGALANMVLQSPETLRIIDPVGFLDMVKLEKHALLVVTDSGGVQKEAYFHRVPCVTLRDETEWVELIEIGANWLAPPRDAQTIVHAIESALTMNMSIFGKGELYGSGDAAHRIAARIAQPEGVHEQAAQEVPR